MGIYWLDTNVFIEAKSTYYPFARVPQFWKFLAQEITRGNICCPRPVYDELMQHKDQLATWAKVRKSSGMCVQQPAEVYKRYNIICDYVVKNTSRHRAEEFLAGADGWVIAYAMHFGGTVVTQEARSRKKKVRIPPICQVLNVSCIDTFLMLDRMGAKFS